MFEKSKKIKIKIKIVKMKSYLRSKFCQKKQHTHARIVLEVIETLAESI